MTAKGCCTEWEQEIILYLDNELSNEGMKRVDKHLTLCPLCKSFYQQMEREEILLAGVVRQETKSYIPNLAFTDQVMMNLPTSQSFTFPKALWNKTCELSDTLLEKGRRHYAVAASILICVIGIFATLNLGNVEGHTSIHFKRSGTIYSCSPQQPFFVYRPQGEYFEFEDRSILYATPETLFSIEAYPDQEEKNDVGMERRIRLQSGELFVDVEKRKEGFSVVSPNARVTVAGTQFYIQVTPGPSKVTTVAVREGQVVVGTEGRNTVPTAGQMTRIYAMQSGKKIVLQSPEPTESMRPDIVHRLEIFNESITKSDFNPLTPDEALYDIGGKDKDRTLISPFDESQL